MQTSNVTLYAIFSKTITATFNYYDGETKSTTLSGVAYNNQTSVSITAPSIANVTLDGKTYTARGWSTNGEGNATINLKANETANLSSNTTYYASYTYTVTLSYDVNGGSGAPNSQSGTAYMNYEGTTIGADITISTTKPTRTGWTFQNWNTQNNGSGTTYGAGETIKISDNTTLYAIWTINKYYIDLNMIVDGTTYGSGYNDRITVGLKVDGKDQGYVEDYYQQHPYGTTWEIYGVKLDGVEVEYTSSGSVGTGNVSLKPEFNTIKFNANNTSYGTLSSSELIILSGKKYSTNGSKLTLEDGRTVTATATNVTGYTTTFTGWSPTSGTVSSATTVTANFSRTANVYTISLDNQSATSAGSTAVYEKYNTGIYKEEGCTNEITTNSNAITKPTKSYTLTYDANGGSVTETSTTASYTFGGYYTSTNGNGTQMINTNGYITSDFKTTQYTANATLYAKWTNNNITLATPTRPGYAFAGWYTQKNGGTQITSTSQITSNKTIYAHWTLNGYTVTYDYKTNGGTSSTKETASVSYGTAIDLSPTATKAGYVFVGWNTNKDATKGLSSLTMQTSNVTLYAIFSKTITATFNYYDGETKSTTLSGVAYNNQTSVSITAPSIANVTLDGKTYTARGWSTNGEGNATINLKANETVNLSSSTTYYASYTYTVTLSYDANGGSGAPSSQTGTAYMNYAGTTIGADITISTIEPTRTGWTFQNWNTESDGSGTTYSVGGTIKLSENDTLYANWKDTTLPTVTMSPNGGTFTLSTLNNCKISVKLNANDIGSGLKTLQYAWSTSNTTVPTEWSTFDNDSTITNNITSVGTYYLWTNVIDNDGNIATNVRTSNEFVVIDDTITITPNTTAWTNNNITVTVKFGDTLTQNRKIQTGYYKGDVNEDGEVTQEDLNILLDVINERVEVPEDISRYDINDDSSIDSSDMVFLLQMVNKRTDLIFVSDKEYTVSGQTTNITIDKNCLIYAEATDTMGNKVYDDLIIDNIDKIAPTVTLSPNGGNYILSSSGNTKISATLNATDNESGLDILSYAWSTSSSSEPSEWSTFTSGETISKSDITTPGTYYLWTKVLDKAGNRATEIRVSNAFVVKSNTDTTGKITITPNTTDWTNQNVIGTVTYGSSLTSNKKAGFGTTLEEAKQAISASTSSRVIATENGYIYAEATDIAGNKISNYLEITNIDKIAPTVGIVDEGVGLYSDPTFASGLNGTAVYNNSQNGTVTNTRVAISDAPSPTSNYGLKITTNGTASPGLGGFYFGTNCSAGKVLITKIVAKIPQGYTIEGGSNQIGNNGKQGWLTSQEGTGDWKEYIFKVECGLTGTITTTNFFYLNGNAATTSQPVTWYVSYAQVFNAGNNLYADPTFASGLNGTAVYNNSKNGTVTNTRVAISDAPNPTSNYGLRVTTSGTASPGLGGFTFATTTASRKVFIAKIIAKIPTGYTLKWATNSTGDGNSKWLTSQAGTGDWKEYIVKLTCGYSGTFSTTNYFYIDGTAATSSNPISWDVSYAQVRDITDINFDKARSLAISGNDSESGISAYGINQSSTTRPTFKEIANNSISEIVSSEQYNSDGTYYIWLKDKAGNISEPKEIIIDIGAEYIFTKSVLDSGTKNGATVASWGSNYGLSITGRANNTPVSGIYDQPLNTLLRWYKTIDFTKYNYLEFQVRKGAENGSSMIYIGNSYIWARYYKDLSTAWTKVKLDISNYTGNQILSFVGGYMDNTGLTTSNTQYLYMRLYK